MEQGNSSLRERLLARLPQSENIAAYKEEVTSLLAKHERALFWERLTARVMSVAAGGVFLIADASPWGRRVDLIHFYPLQFSCGVIFFAGLMAGLQYHVSRAKVDVLKEVKQVQLQVLELQGSIEKRRAE